VAASKENVFVLFGSNEVNKQHMILNIFVLYLVYNK